jgi:ion channel
MRVFAITCAILLITLVAQDAFETIVLPRRVTRRIRLARLFYRVSQLGWNAVGRLIRSSSRRDSFRGYVAPLSLLALLVFWAALFIIGYGVLLWGLAVPLTAINQPINLTTYLYLSSTTFFTLGLGDVAPVPGLGRFLLVSEAALGFIFLALMITYVPVLYQAFSRRELRISLLDARAGSPGTAVELLRRNCAGGAGQRTEELRLLLRDWEVWCADILESHLSYPILAFYRSQHEQQSWVGALTIILDTCALILTTVNSESPPGGTPVDAAKFTFAMARHAVVDLVQVLNIPPPTGVNRLSSAQFTQLQEILGAEGIRLRERRASEQQLTELRATYEPFVWALAQRIQVSLPPWIPPNDTPDDWQTSSWDARFPSMRQTLENLLHRD